MLNKSNIKNIICKVLKIESSVKEDALAFNNHPNWDSLGHVILLSALEQEFDIIINYEDYC